VSSKTLFSLAEVACRLQVPESDVRAAIAEGLVDVEAVAGRYVFDEDDIADLDEVLSDYSPSDDDGDGPEDAHEEE
jgi:hypothetical protein